MGRRLHPTVTGTIDHLEQAFRSDAWHGPSLQSALRGVVWQEAIWRPGAFRPSIWAIVLHCAYWKLRVLERVTGARVVFPRPGKDWPELPAEANDGAWREDRRLLRTAHDDLLGAVRLLEPEDLDRPGPRQQRSRRQNLDGIAFHDAYHAGQIRLIRKLHEEHVS